jgi:protein involved in polysaccharide export with SLBB domain
MNLLARALPWLLAITLGTWGLAPGWVLAAEPVPVPASGVPVHGSEPQVSLGADQEVAFDTPEAIRDYHLSVGDTIAINLWATDLRLSQTFTIPFEGKIYIPNLGEIPVNRLTTEQVRADLLRRLGGRIRNLHASVLLTKTRRINVYVTGMVGAPGIATVPVLSRLSVALGQVGGILPEGSLRRITLTHEGQKPETIDWYQFLNRGDLRNNPRLEAGDVINVPSLGNQVSIDGAVYRPGQYETLPGETVSDLLFLAHGTRADAALEKASLVHQVKSASGDRQERPLDLTLPESRTLKLQNRDRVYIPTNTLAYIPLTRTKVQIQGEVVHEGNYTLTIGQTLRDLFFVAGGPKGGAGLREVRIFHKAQSGTTAQAPARLVNAYKLLYENDEAQNVELADGDLVMVPSNKLPVEDSVINVQGQVGKPGPVPFRVGAKLSDYLNAAGGPLPRADLRRVTVTRAGHAFHVDAYRVMREGRVEGDLELEEKDIVFVPESFFYVSNFQDVVNTILAAAGIWAIVQPLIKH